MKLAERVCRISESPTLAVSAKASALRASGIDVIDFSAGEPDFPTPENIKKKGITAIESNFTKYTATAGIKKLRDAVAKRYQEKYGYPFTAQNVILSNGAKQALFNLFLCLVEEGEEVLIPEPYWVTFPEQVQLAGGIPVYVPSQAEEHFELKADEVEKKITEKTRVLLLNSPNNPSGGVIPRNTLSDVVQICRQRNIKIIFDECYDCFVFPPYQHTSPLHFLPEAKDITFVVNTFSKAYAMTGWRLGLTVGPPDVIAACDKLQGHTTSNPSSISQIAGLEALEGDQTSLSMMFDEYERRRNFIYDALSAMPGVQCNVPQGAFYVFPDISAHLNENLPDSIAFCEKLLEECHVGTVPGSAFGREGHIRISYATSMENLKEGCRRIHEFLKR
ncbi:pyridoxal phosphate-dependent aminotransferase [bacterium]|nr:pyridoxal phosphate-dependent aminotransferase [bacterium]